MVSLQYNSEVWLIGKAILIAIIGIFVGFAAKHIIRKIVDKGVLKKVFKDAQTYETGTLINKIFTEALMWIIVIGFVNYSLTMLGFNFLTNALEYIITNIPKIAGFIFIILAGLLVSKIIIARIKEQEIENKNEITTLTELIVMAAFLLTALEFIGVKATALVELYKVILYIIGIILVLLLINPKFFDRLRDKNKDKNKNKKENSTIKLFSF